MFIKIALISAYKDIVFRSSAQPLLVSNDGIEGTVKHTVEATQAFFFSACFNLQSDGFASNSLADAKATIAFRYGFNVFAACLRA